MAKFLSDDGRRLLGAVGEDFKLWDTLTGREILSLLNPPDGGSIVVAKDGGRIAVLRGDKTLKVFDGRTGKELSTLRNASSLALSGDRKPMASVSAGKTVELWPEDAVEIMHGPDDRISDSGNHENAAGAGHRDGHLAGRPAGQCGAVLPAHGKAMGD
jgi:WD40 repeat protein